MSTSFDRTNIPQTGQAWHDWRSEGIGATDAGIIIADGKGAETLLRVKTGKKEASVYQSPEMLRGKDLEPEARAAYIKEVGITVKPACVENIKTRWLRASLDGISEDGETVVEIKCGDKDYEDVSASGVLPKQYMAQMQHILAVTGLDSLDLWCYVSGKQGIKIPVPRDDEYIQRLFKSETAFWKRVQAELLDIQFALKVPRQPVDPFNPLHDIFSVEYFRIHGFDLKDMEMLVDRLNLLISPRDLVFEKSLNLASTGLTVLPPEIGKLTNLEQLYLRNNLLSDLPEEIGNLTSLTTLDLTQNGQLSRLPPQIGKLSSLVSLNLTGNSKLTTLPPEIGELKNLKELWLTRTGLTSLPPAIGMLSNLSILNMHKCPLTALPIEIGGLTNLTALSLSETQLTALPPEIGSLHALKGLSVYAAKQLTALPPEIGNLVSISHLDLRHCQLKDLPLEIGELTNLEVLELEDNLLTGLPPEIGKLSKLKRLYLGDNRLSALPMQLGQLSSLEVLHVNRNRLTAIPNTIEKLANIRPFGKQPRMGGLDFSENFLTVIPPEVLARYRPQFIFSDSEKSRPKPSNSDRQRYWLDISRNRLH